MAAPDGVRYWVSSELMTHEPGHAESVEFGLSSPRTTGTSTAMMAVMVDVPRDLRTLWRLTGADPLDPAADWNTMFESVGLILYALPRREEYWCTPINSITFATTGGDGVHFGWVTLPGRPVDDAPIVMTVPMAETTTNVIVGRDLREFLSLGCRFGSFTLDALVQDPDGTIDEIEANRVDPDRSDDERALLDLLTSEFGLAPWHDPARRMGELQVEYLKLLEIPPPPDPGSWTVADAERPHTTVLVPPPPDEALVRSRDFFRSLDTPAFRKIQTALHHFDWTMVRERDMKVRKQGIR